MKVRLEDDYRDIYTLNDVDRAKAVIKAEAADLETAKYYAETAINEYLSDKDDYLMEILKAEATTVKNDRVWNAYKSLSDPDMQTGHMDVWIGFIAETANGFIKGGAYLSDIWKTGIKNYKQYVHWDRRMEMQCKLMKEGRRHEGKAGKELSQVLHVGRS